MNRLLFFTYILIFFKAKSLQNIMSIDLYPVRQKLLTHINEKRPSVFSI
jgi:hypothetical protein